MGGVVVVNPAPDTVAEMKVSSADFSLTEPGSSGAFIPVFSKAGNNKFHGTLSEFHTNNALTSRTVFS